MIPPPAVPPASGTPPPTPLTAPTPPASTPGPPPTALATKVTTPPVSVRDQDHDRAVFRIVAERGRERVRDKDAERERERERNGYWMREREREHERDRDDVPGSETSHSHSHSHSRPASANPFLVPGASGLAAQYPGYPPQGVPGPPGPPPGLVSPHMHEMHGAPLPGHEPSPPSYAHAAHAHLAAQNGYPPPPGPPPHISAPVPMHPHSHLAPHVSVPMHPHAAGPHVPMPHPHAPVPMHPHPLAMPPGALPPQHAGQHQLQLPHQYQHPAAMHGPGLPQGLAHASMRIPTPPIPPPSMPSNSRKVSTPPRQAYSPAPPAPPPSGPPPRDRWVIILHFQVYFKLTNFSFFSRLLVWLFADLFLLRTLYRALWFSLFFEMVIPKSIDGQNTSSSTTIAAPRATAPT